MCKWVAFAIQWHDIQFNIHNGHAMAFLQHTHTAVPPSRSIVINDGTAFSFEFHLWVCALFCSFLFDIFVYSPCLNSDASKTSIEWIAFIVFITIVKQTHSSRGNRLRQHEIIPSIKQYKLGPNVLVVRRLQIVTNKTKSMVRICLQFTHKMMWMAWKRGRISIYYRIKIIVELFPTHTICCGN